MKKFLLKTKMDGILNADLMTADEISDFYATCDSAGIFGDYELIEVWDIEEDPKKVNIRELVRPILENRRWMEAELESAMGI